MFAGDAGKVEECFNKRLFHLTYRRLEVSDEEWCVNLAFPPVEAKAKEFIKHILSMLLNNEFTSPSVSREIQVKELEEWKELQKDIESVDRPPLQANKSANTSNVGGVSTQYCKL